MLPVIQAQVFFLMANLLNSRTQGWSLVIVFLATYFTYTTCSCVCNLFNKILVLKILYFYFLALLGNSIKFVTMNCQLFNKLLTSSICIRLIIFSSNEKLFKFFVFLNLLLQYIKFSKLSEGDFSLKHVRIKINFFQPLKCRLW